VSEIPTTTLDLRPIAEDDLEAVVALSLRAWAPVFESFEAVLGHEIFQRLYPDWLTSQSAVVTEVCRGPHVWVATHYDPQPIGFVAVALRQDASHSAEIDMIAVDPQHQGQGVATALMQTAIDFMRREGVRLAEVGTGGDIGHLPARRTYEKAGFVALPLVRYYKAL
jgi:GNAT superfamily N-acetyltransferase